MQEWTADHNPGAWTVEHRDRSTIDFSHWRLFPTEAEAEAFVMGYRAAGGGRCTILRPDAYSTDAWAGEIYRAWLANDLYYTSATKHRRSGYKVKATGRYHQHNSLAVQRYPDNSHFDTAARRWMTMVGSRED